jgi:hypothetical protein
MKIPTKPHPEVPRWTSFLQGGRASAEDPNYRRVRKSTEGPLGKQQQNIDPEVRIRMRRKLDFMEMAIF